MSKLFLKLDLLLLICLLLLSSCIADKAPVPESTYSPIESKELFSVLGGMYDKEIKLILNVPAGYPKGSYVLYTLDGKAPDTNSKKYTVPIKLLSLKESEVVQAAVFNRDNRLSPIYINTYIKKKDNALRTVAITVKEEYLYDSETGLLANPSQSGAEWEKEAFVEVFEPDGRKVVSDTAGLRLSGAGSRSFVPPSFRVIARNNAGKFKYALFDDPECDRFILRNGGNDALTQAREDFTRMNSLRDAIANNYISELEKLKGFDVYAQEAVPVSVYLNGQYYGMLNMKEDFGDDLLRDKYDIDNDYITILKGKYDHSIHCDKHSKGSECRYCGVWFFYKVDHGPEEAADDFTALLKSIIFGYKDDEKSAYTAITDNFDISNMIWYYAIDLYTCNTDWPHNNACVWKYDKGDGKWRFVIRDMDLSFALHDEASRSSSTTYSMADTDTFWRLLTSYWDGSYNYDKETGLYPDSMYLEGLLDRALRNSDFRAQFEKACRYLVSDEATGVLKRCMTEYVEKAKADIQNHLSRWSERIYDGYTVECFNNSMKDMEQWLVDRSEYFLQYMEHALSKYSAF